MLKSVIEEFTVGTETEIKLFIAAPDEFRRRIEELQPDLLSPRHLEDNFVLDFPDDRIRLERSLIRVRHTDTGSNLTYKGPPRPEGKFKVREELETVVGDASIVVEILGRLGLAVRFRYQKYREEYKLAGSKGSGEIHLAFDETPIGTYAELEGPEAAIVDIAHRLGFNASMFIRSSYYSLYLDYCEQHGLEPTHMLMPQGTA